MPLARSVVRQIAAEHGACLRPVQLRRTDVSTGRVEQILVPCGHTLASVCAPCAERARVLRAAQCREGWHLDHEPVIDPDDPDDWQRWLVEKRAETQAERDRAGDQGEDTAELDALNGELDEEITRSGVRGKVLPARPARRHRSTRRRQDAPDLPRRKVAARTVGKTYTAPDGTTFRPSMFVTLTCPSYGRVGSDGTPADPDRYDYGRAARDALHFAALFDRFIQNLRRFLGYDVQYFAAVEPQRRLAPHVHIAMRGTVSRTELRQVLAATYHQVWWPDTSDGPLPRRRAAGLARGQRQLPRPRDRRSPAHLGRRARRDRPGGRAAARRPVRRTVRRPGRAGRVPGRQPVHRLPHQVPDQARRRLPPGADTRPARARRTARRRAPVRALLPHLRELAALRRPAQERPRGPAAGRTARARPIAANTSATRAAASWSRASGRARRWPTTAATAGPG